MTCTFVIPLMKGDIPLAQPGVSLQRTQDMNVTAYTQTASAEQQQNFNAIYNLNTRDLVTC